MTPGTYNLTLYQGDSREIKLRLRQDAAYVDLTGWVGRSQIRARAAAPLMAEFTVTIDNQVTNRGGVTLSMSDEEAQNLVPGSAAWDLELEEPGGIVRTWVRGTVTIEGDITREGLA